MKTAKKLLAVLSAAVMAVSFITVSAAAADDGSITISDAKVGETLQDL